MTNLYRLNPEYSARGIDYDLCGCLESNSEAVNGLTPADIERVLAVWEGQNEDDDWRWILQLKAEQIDRFVYMRAGCDYTGWDCASWVDNFIGSSFSNDLLPHIQSHNPDEVYNSLKTQLESGDKNATWRETTDKEMGIG